MSRSRSLINLKGMIVDAEMVSLPTNRIFRSAWEIRGTIVSTNMTEARDIWRNNIRAARTDKFEPLDADFMKAYERGVDIINIVAQKEILRDAPAHISITEATTPEMLLLAVPPGFNQIEIITRGRGI